MVKKGAFSLKIDSFSIFEENLNLKGHLNRSIGSKVTAILVNGGFYLGVELHREGSVPAVCSAGLLCKDVHLDLLIDGLKCNGLTLPLDALNITFQ